MRDEETIDEILSLSNDAVQTECSIFKAPLDSENYGDLLSPFTTPRNKYICLDLEPCAPDENQGKQDVSDPLTFPEGSPVTPQIPESSTFLSEIDVECQDPSTLFESRTLRDQCNQGNHCQDQCLTISKSHIRTNQQHAIQVRHSMDTDLQELLDLGKAMNLPSGPELGISTFCPVECRGSQAKNGNSDSIALLPFPLDEIFTPQTSSETVSEHTIANHNVFALTPNMAQSCPGSPTVLRAEAGGRRQILSPKQHCDPMVANIDEVLLEVARRNFRTHKPDIVATSTQGDETPPQVARKKRKLSSTTAVSCGDEDGSCRTIRSVDQRKKSFKKGQGHNRADIKKSGKVQSSPGSAPSRFCHICTRAAKPDVILVCANVGRGTCRKVICFKCIREMSWDWGSLQGNEEWTCTHCRKDCPAKAQCHTYRRVNQNRRADGRRSRKITNPSAKLSEGNDRGSN